VFSASVWASSIPVESTGKEKEKEKEKLLESVSLEMQSIRFGLFLFSVCHVILVVQDTPHDPNLWRYVRNLELLKHAIPDPGRPNATDQIPFPTPTDPHNTLLFGDRRVEFLPQIGSPLFFPPLFHFFLILIQMDLFSSSFSLVFVVNKVHQDFFLRNAYLSTTSQLQTLFKDSHLQMSGHVRMPENLITFNTESTTRHLHLFLLPREEPNTPKPAATAALNLEDQSPFASILNRPFGPRVASFQRLSEQLRNQLFALPRRVYPHPPPSERDWFKASAKIWDRILHSDTANKFARHLHDSIAKPVV